MSSDVVPSPFGSPARQRRQGQAAANLAGLALTVVLHGAVVAFVLWGHRLSPPPVEAPRELMVAQLVQLGKPRPKELLPRIATPPPPQAPEAAVKVTHNPEAPPSPKEEPRPKEAEPAQNLQRALQRAKMLAQASDEPAEGLETGSPDGTATEASAGDAYATEVHTAIRRNWVVPDLVTEAQLRRLRAEVRVRVGSDGTLTDGTLVRSSGNSYFDDACVQAVSATGRVPPPPPALRKLAARGFILEFVGKDM